MENNYQTLPQAADAERSVLGSMLKSSEALMLAQESLKEEDFYDPIHRELFSAMLYLSAKSQTVDVVTLSQELTRRGIAKELWDEALTELPESDDAIVSLLRSRLRGEAPEGDALRRAAGYLQRRGYSWEEIRSAAEQLKKEEEAWTN